MGMLSVDDFFSSEKPEDKKPSSLTSVTPQPQPTTSSSGMLSANDFFPETTQPVSTPTVAPTEPTKEIAALPSYSKNEYTIDDIKNNDEIYNDVTKYLTTRFNEPPKKGESRDDVIGRFLGHMRFTDFNTVGSVNELNWMRNATKDDAIIAAKVHDLYEKTASFYEKGGGSVAGAAYDIGKAFFLDPITYLGFGAGSVAKFQAARAATKAGMSTLLKGKLIAGGTALETLAGAGQAVTSERIKQETDVAMDREVRDISALNVGLAAAISAFGGYAGAAGAVRSGVKESTKEQLEKVITAKTKDLIPSSVTAPATPYEIMVADALRDNMDQLTSEYRKLHGREVLDAIDPVQPLTDAKVRDPISQVVVRIAGQIIRDDPTFQLKPGQQITDAITNVIRNLDINDINNVHLEQALRTEGVSLDMLADAIRTTKSEAGRELARMSVEAKLYKKMAEVDPEAASKIKELFGKDDDFVSSMGYLGRALSRGDRETKAWVVSGLGTTLRNIQGTGVGLTMNAAASLLEGSFYALGKTLKAVSTGQSTSLSKDMWEVVKDSTRALSYLLPGKRAGISAELTDQLLQHNPTLKSHLLHALQESSSGDISAIGRAFNSLNVAQDAFFRRAIFNASVEKNLKSVGLDMYQLLRENKHIPADILSASVDDALKGTFSYMPKPTKKGVVTFEGGAETLANHFVKTFEGIPGGSLLVTFPRFMSNAIAFQYRYSVLGMASGMEDLFKGAMKNNSVAGSGDKLVRQGSAAISRGVVGTAALMAAYTYRSSNPESAWYNYTTDSGMTIDLRPIFPIGPYLAVAEFARAMINNDPKKAKETIETIAGMKLPAGSQNTMIDQIISAASSEKDANKLDITIGKIVGDYGSRLTAPFPIRTISDYLSLFDREEAYARDPNVITGDNKMLEAAGARVKKSIYGLKQDLPEAVTRLRPETQVQEGAFFRDLMGITAKAPTNFAEKEITRLHIDPYRLFGGSSGDKEYDRELIKTANPIVLETIKRVTDNEKYQQLSPAQQRLALFDAVQTRMGQAHGTVQAKLANKDFSELFRLQFIKMSADERKAINEEYAKEHDGVTLEQAKDYRSVPQYHATAVERNKFAVGGLAKGLGKAVSKLLGEEIEQTVKKSIDFAASASDEVVAKANANLTAVPKAVEPMEDLVSAAESSFTKPSTTTDLLAATPQPVAAIDVPQYNAIDFYKNKTDYFSGYSKEDIAKAEQQLWDKYEDPELMAKYPDEFANELANNLQKNMGIKQKTYPYPEYEDDPSSWISLDATDAKSKKWKEEYESSPFYVEQVAKETSTYNPKALSGDLSKVEKHGNKDRNEIVDQIRDIRTEAFPTLKEMNKDGFDDIVLGKTQGEFRYATGHEVDLLNDKDTALFFRMAKKEQEELNRLRKEFGDRPDVTLMHGGTKDLQKFTETGLLRPTGEESDRLTHKELNVGATSFTRDFNLGANEKMFGGTIPEQYIKTVIPYPEFKFMRINLSPDQYSNADLGVLAKSVTGDPRSTRTVGLPRGVFGEHEDMVIEADKFNIQSGAKQMRGLLSPKDSFESKVFEMSPSPAKYSQEEIDYLVGGSKGAYQVDKGTLRKSLEKLEDEDFGSLTNSELNKYYGEVKSFLKILASKTQRTDPSAGMGQQYHKDLRKFAATPDSLIRLAEALSEKGYNEKAYLISRLAKELDLIKQDVDSRDTIKSVSKVFQMTDKFNRGGLAKRKS